MMTFEQYQEEIDYEEGVRATEWLIGKKEAIDAAPVRGEEGWSEEIEAQRQSIYAQIG